MPSLVPIDHSQSGEWLPEKDVALFKRGESESCRVTMSVRWDPNADFEYFASECFTCDGTLLFLYESCVRLLFKVLNCETHYKPKQDQIFRNGAKITYVIGNYVVLSEFDEDRTRFTPPDKPWCRERYTVLLPIQMIVE